MDEISSPYFYSFYNNPKDFKSGQHAGSDQITEDPNLNTINKNPASNDEWNKAVNDRQTHTFDPRFIQN